MTTVTETEAGLLDDDGGSPGDRKEFDPRGNSAPEVGLGHDKAVWLS